MTKILFIPLNTNHILIYQNIFKNLRYRYEVISHDKISEEKQYRTGKMLKKIGIDFRHFPENIYRSVNDSLLKKVINFFKIKKNVRLILKEITPSLIVLASDNDPIANIFISESKKHGIKTVLIQEALIRPYEYLMREKYFSDYIHEILSIFGIYIFYTIYGTGGCTQILVGGKLPEEILKKRGVPKEKIKIVGHPKYDRMINKIKTIPKISNPNKVYLFAASSTIIADNQNIRFLEKLVDSTRRLQAHLIIKLHPRGVHEPAELYNLLDIDKEQFVEIIKEGDDTFEILKRVDVLITISSTIVLEALMMDKECITINYLAGEFCLEYRKYDALHAINREDEIYHVLKKAISEKKSYKNKRELLEDELYRLDGNAGKRAAITIENLASDS